MKLTTFKIEIDLVEIDNDTINLILKNNLKIKGITETAECFTVTVKGTKENLINYLETYCELEEAKAYFNDNKF